MFRLLFILFSYQVAVHGSGTPSALSPVQNLEASLAASVAQSTTLAIECTDGILLLYRSPQRATSKLLAPLPKGVSFKRNGLKLYEVPQSTPKWRLLAPNCFCTMTGFSADVSHLTKVLARTVESNHVLYNQDLPVQKIVRSLSSTLQGAAQRDGSRPYGIQALLVGLANDNEWRRFTCDPTGVYRHYPKGALAIIGKFSEAIQKEASEVLDKETGDAAGMLDACFKAIVQASKSENVKLENDTFEGLLLWKSKDGECEVAQIDPEYVAKRYLEIQQTVSSSS